MIVSHRRYTDHVTDDGNVLTRCWHSDGRVQVLHFVTWHTDDDGVRTGVYVPRPGEG